MLSQSKLQSHRRMDATDDLSSAAAPTLPSTAKNSKNSTNSTQTMKTKEVQAVKTPPAKKRAGGNFQVESVPLTTEEKKETAEKKWNGVKEKDATAVFNNIEEGTYMRMTDTLNLGDVWFKPVTVARNTSKFILSVIYTIVICGEKLLMKQHEYKTTAEELLKMIFLAKKSRAYYFGFEFPTDYSTWFDMEKKAFLANPAAVKGDGSDAAFAEYQISNEDFKLNKGEDATQMYILFRKTNRHSYTVASTASYETHENPNSEHCEGSRGSYLFTIESRIMMLPIAERGEKKIKDIIPEEIPESQPF